MNLQFHYEAKLKENVFMATPITFFIKVDYKGNTNSITRSLTEFLKVHEMLEETKDLFKVLNDNEIEQKSLNIPITGKSQYEFVENEFKIHPDKQSAKP